MTYRALLIGNSVFDADASLHPLNAPVKDVARLHRALVDGDTGMFGEEAVRLVTERTCDAVLDELDQFFAAAGRDDLLLLYYSGHGLLDERNQLYLCGRDTRSDRLLRTAVSNVRINEFVTQSLCRRTVIILDCCSSGMFKAGGSIEVQLAGPGRYIVSSTRGRELANDAAAPTGTSLFTEHLVQGLLGAAPDTNGDGYLDLREVYDYVRDRLRETSKQVPHCRFDGDGAVNLAKVRAAPAVARAVSEERLRFAEPTFALAENTITFRDLEVGDELQAEVVEVLPLTHEPLDLSVHTDDDWLSVSVSACAVTVVLRPRLGRNQGKVTVRDRRSGSAQVLRVEARVRPTPVLPLPGGDPPTVPPADPTGALPDAPAPAASMSKGASEIAAPTELAPTPEPARQSEFTSPPYEGTATNDPVRDGPAGSSTAAPAVDQDPPRAAPAARLRQRVARLGGLAVALIGALLLCIAFGGAAWYAPVDGKQLDAGGLHSAAAAVPGAQFSEAMFHGGGWLCIAVCAVLAVLASLRTGIGATVLRVSAAFTAMLGAVLTLIALNDLVDAARRAGQTVSGVFDDTRSGLPLMFVGFGLVAVSAAVPSNARWATWRRSTPAAESSDDKTTHAATEPLPRTSQEVGEANEP